MSNDSSIFAEGARRVWRRQRIVWWIFAVNLILAFTSAMPLVHRIGAVTDHSVAAQRIANGFDWGTYSELLSTPDVNFGSAYGEAVTAILVFFVFMLFMTGGILASYANQYKLSTREFFASCGAFFWRSFRLMIFTAVVLVPIAFASKAALHWAGDLISDAAGEKTGYFVYLAFLLLTAAIFMLVRLWFDMAQVQAVIEDERAMRRTCLRAFKLTLSNLGSLYWLYFRISFLAWLGVAIGLGLWIRLTGGVAVIMFECVMLWWVGTRMWQRAGEVAWYQRHVVAAAPMAAAVPVVTPTSEAAPVVASPEPLPPDE